MFPWLSRSRSVTAMRLLLPVLPVGLPLLVAPIIQLLLFLTKLVDCSINLVLLPLVAILFPLLSSLRVIYSNADFASPALCFGFFCLSLDHQCMSLVFPQPSGHQPECTAFIFIHLLVLCSIQLTFDCAAVKSHSNHQPVFTSPQNVTVKSDNVSISL